MIVVHERPVRFNDCRPAEAANAATAQVGNLDTRRLNRFEKTLIRYDVHVEVGLCEKDIEGITHRRRTELLPMDVAVRPASRARRLHYFFNHRTRPAYVDMRAQRLVRQEAFEVDELPIAVIVLV